MEFHPNAVETAVWQFYQGGASPQSLAHEWLKKAKSSREAWDFVWDLLIPHKTLEVQFFAALTLHTKIKKSLNEICPELRDLVKNRLLGAIINYNDGPKIVLNRLCISLSAYLIQTCPEKWPNAIPQLLNSFTCENYPNISELRLLWVLLEILIVLPEELSCAHLLQHQKGPLHNHLNHHTQSVMALLERIFLSYSDQELILQAIKCLSSWITIGVPMIQFQNLSDILVDLVFSNHRRNPGICEKAVECLKAIVDQPDQNQISSCISEFLMKILSLKFIIEKELDLNESMDQELISNIYNLFLSFGGTYSQRCLNWIQDGGNKKDHVLSLITSILQCSGAKGYYPVDETYSRLAFGFWYILQDDITSSSPQKREIIMKELGPIYDELVDVLITKAQLPDPDKNFTEEDMESFRCYRQDISDTLMYCHSILRGSIIRLIHFRLEKIDLNETKWQELEACLFSLSSVSEHVGSVEDKVLPTLFYYIRNLPYQRLDPKVFSTALDTIGAYSDWISTHTSTLEYVLPLIIIGINVPETMSSATMALKDLSRDCQYSIKPYASLILEASQKALHGGRLKLNDSQRLMWAIGKLLSFLPMDTIMYYLNLLLTPYLDELEPLICQPPSPQGKSSIILFLKIIGVLSSSLNTKLEYTSDHFPIYVRMTNELQPVLIILRKLLPAMKVIANSWSSDEHVMQSLFAALKHSVTTLREDSRSVMTEISELILTTYRVHPQPAALDLSKTLCAVLGKDVSCWQAAQTLASELCVITIRALSSTQNLSDLTDVLEAFFAFSAQIVKKTPKLIEFGDPTSIFHWATTTLAIPELPTVKSAASFLVNIITQSSEVESFKNAVRLGGERLVLQVISCIAGETPRSNIEPFAQIFLALNKNYCEHYSRWLRCAVIVNPCLRGTIEEKESFVSSLLTQKRKVSLQETLKKFSFICRGIAGTEYAHSVSPFT